MDQVTVTACAKINLGLSIPGKRADGYHEIDTVMQSVDLADRLEIQKSGERRVYCPGIAQEDNLAFRAMRVFLRESGLSDGAVIRLSKRIPLAAGLGGGSADAAAVLCGLDRLYETHASAEDLSAMAAGLGADVPFFLSGGTARARGFGEQLTALPPLCEVWFLLFGGGQKPSTAEMYRRLDGIFYPKPSMETVLQALSQKDFTVLNGSGSNSFSPFWPQGAAEELAVAFGAEAVFLSGSGPTRVAVFRQKDLAETAQKRLSEENVPCFLAKPTPCALFFE
ncbi:MAG: 4-(cytidine 5'-diphospho)-2-C-methyl-D-erythritol kinase [Clostridia bacterium]|nr:4-(cytidine 5'-diphospho)-2-C-methyl-D-erythritol kinase [Clostridia bacterium]